LGLLGNLEEFMAVRELTTKADLKAMKAMKAMKANLVKWIAGLLLVQATVIAALVKLL
jgi:hypothetical protein